MLVGLELCMLDSGLSGFKSYYVMCSIYVYMSKWRAWQLSMWFTYVCREFIMILWSRDLCHVFFIARHWLARLYDGSRDAVM